MIRSCIEFLFGCTHQRLSFPMTTPQDGTAGGPSAHVTCLDCGKEFWYDWESMRQTSEKRPTVQHGNRAA
jgi:hypothetical protein